ncbi:MAG TPA: hypothetical protein VFQ23_02215 [Anaerolineales bacterium]|nr:hypothetical protein [Anaerolineales bacterium]
MTMMETLRSRKLIIPMLVVFVALLVQTSWAEEDAFITLRTSDNLIHGYGPRWNVAERVQTFTNPFWMFLLAGTHAIIKNPHITLILLSIFVSVLAMLIMLVYLPQTNFGVVLAFSILVLSKAFVDFSTSGLENPASHLLIVCFAAFYLRSEKPLSERNLFFVSLFAGLAAFNRLDLFLFCLPALVATLFAQFNRRNILIMLAGLSPVLVWEIFAVIYYGFPVPNTYYAKLHTGVPFNESITQGILYFINSFGWDPITLTIVFSAIGLPLVSRYHERILLALGIVLYLGYILYIGGDFMSGRFFSTPLMISVALLVHRVEDATTLEKYAWISLVLLLGLILAPLKSFNNPIESDVISFDSTAGIADERFGYYRYSNLLLFSRDQDFQLYEFAQYGIYLRREKIPLATIPAIGMVGYYAGPGTYIIDKLGLGDPLMARLKRTDPKNWQIAHIERNVPDGYGDSIENNENRINDPALAEYYDKLLLITRGDIWSAQRWEAIWKMNTGQYDYLLERYAKSQK